jgi:hypothetical protein
LADVQILQKNADAMRGIEGLLISNTVHGNNCNLLGSVGFHSCCAT